MTQLLNGISEVFNNIIGVFKGISIGDILDIVILTFLIYKAVQLVRETHAGQLLKGIIFLVLIDILVNVLDMTMMKVILQTVWSVGILALIVLFQPELRHVLEQLGRNKLGSLGAHPLGRGGAAKHPPQHRRGMQGLYVYVKCQGGRPYRI